VRGVAGSCRLVGRRTIAGNGTTGRGPSDASGLSAGITIVAAILLGTGIGLGLGYLTGLTVVLALVGAAVGLVFGFYVVYITFFRIPPA
jgi:uncharacterized membrane protein